MHGDIGLDSLKYCEGKPQDAQTSTRKSKSLGISVRTFYSALGIAKARKAVTLLSHEIWNNRNLLGAYLEFCLVVSEHYLDYKLK
jgi:hypothetical protein